MQDCDPSCIRICHNILVLHDVVSDWERWHSIQHSHAQGTQNPFSRSKLYIAPSSPELLLTQHAISISPLLISSSRLSSQESRLSNFSNKNEAPPHPRRQRPRPGSLGTGYRLHWRHDVLSVCFGRHWHGYPVYYNTIFIWLLGYCSIYYIMPNIPLLYRRPSPPPTWVTSALQPEH